MICRLSKFGVFTLIGVLSTSAHADWTFDVVAIGDTTSSSNIVFPVLYSHANCSFTIMIDNNGATDDVYIENVGGCTDSNHFLVIDHLSYPLDDTLEVNFNPSQISFFGDATLGNCGTVSGDPILINSPKILMDGHSIEIESTEQIEIFSFDSNFYFKVNSANGDVECDNGLPFINPIDLIYFGGFE